jgi:outer membrane receptor for ferrienterochelin and colicins
VRLINASGDTRTHGAEAMLRYRVGEITVTGSYVYTQTSEPDPNGVARREIPLTPKHSASVVAVWEREDVGRVGLESYFTGRQSLNDNPYRTRSKPYLLLGMMAERRLGKVSVFINVENLLDVRQSKTDPMLRPSRASDGSWTVDAWGPTDGRVANAGVRVRFGGTP